MKKKILIISLPIFLLVGVLLIINQQNIFIQKEDPNFFDTTCATPCLLGITPGITTEDEANSIIKENSRFENCQEFDNTDIGGVRWIECDEIVIVPTDNEISQIGFFSPGLKLKEVIEKYGDPDKMRISFLTQFPFSIGVQLFYHKIHTQVRLISRNGIHYDISPNTSIESVTFFSQEIYDQLIKENWIYWNGYGRYEPSSP